MATLALLNLDTGLFFSSGAWTSDHKLSQSFPDQTSVSKAAVDFKVKNAAAALIEGDPPQVRGFFWISNPNRP
ncbi:MAG TPA: hypothetical protein VFE51_14280 [Verrucomicrobiae bacterium]|nr:hypothetical protein [Verrucomicrobiae bacterium]